MILADQQLPKLELKNYSKNVLTTPMFFKELRSWRLNNLIDYISGKRKARKDLTKPKLKILSKVKGKYKSKIYQIHRYLDTCPRHYKPRLVYFYTIFEDHFFDFKVFFSENSVLMYWLVFKSG